MADDLDIVQHPVLGELKFPKDMPFTERNASIDRLERQQPLTTGNPTGMANRALELASPGRGMQVSGREMRMAKPNMTSDSAPVAGAISAVNENVLPMLKPRNPKGTMSDVIHEMGTAAPATLQGITQLPKKAGTAIAGSINAFRGDNPIEGFQHAYEGAGDVAQLAPITKLGAGMGADVTAPMVKSAVTSPVRGAARTINAGIRNAPTILGTTGAVSGGIAGGMGSGRAGLGMMGAVPGSLWGAYEGTRLGKYIQKAPPLSENPFVSSALGIFKILPFGLLFFLTPPFDCFTPLCSSNILIGQSSWQSQFSMVSFPFSSA